MNTEPETIDLMITGMNAEEKKRFRALCALENKTSAQLLSSLMEFYENRTRKIE